MFYYISKFSTHCYLLLVQSEGLYTTRQCDTKVSRCPPARSLSRCVIGSFSAPDLTTVPVSLVFIISRKTSSLKLNHENYKFDFWRRALRWFNKYFNTYYIIGSKCENIFWHKDTLLEGKEILDSILSKRNSVFPINAIHIRRINFLLNKKINI